MEYIIGKVNSTKYVIVTTPETIAPLCGYFVVAAGNYFLQDGISAVFSLRVERVESV